MATDFNKAFKKVREVMMFENWLRFYFISEDNAEGEEEKLSIVIPEKAQMRIREEYPHLWVLVETLNNKEITPESSREAVIMFVSNELDGSVIKVGMGPRVFDSSNFQFEMHLFNTWVQMHEEQLDKGFVEFGKFCELFDEWKKTDKVKAYIEEVRERMSRAAGSHTEKAQ